MAGVEILATTEVVVATAFNWVSFWIILAVLTVIGIGICYALYKTDCDIGIFIALIPIMFLGVVLGGAVGCAAGKPTEYETLYKVTISDKVNLNEFMEKYEIIEQEGKIYTVREKENESKN